MGLTDILAYSPSSGAARERKDRSGEVARAPEAARGPLRNSADFGMPAWLHSLPDSAPPEAPPGCDTFTSDWTSYLKAETITLCSGHSTIQCARRTRPTEAVGTPFFCWVRNAYQSTDALVWHAFCTPEKEHWDGDPEANILWATFGKKRNHFSAQNGYLRVHPLEDVPRTMAGKAALPVGTTGEIAYLLDGDSQAVPKFNPWHANADLLNFFIARRMMSAFVHSAADASWSVFLLRGCGGLTHGRANWNMWRAIVGGGTIHARELWRPQHDVHAETLVSRNWTLRRAGIAVLSPDPWHSPLWQLQTSIAQCPHRSSILHDFRAAIVPPLDKLVLNRAAFFRALRAEHPSNVRFLGSPPERSRSLVFLVRRANGVSCPRCLKNAEELAQALAAQLPGASVIAANPGSLSFTQQYALFRASHLVIGAHGSGVAYGICLTPAQAFVELALPGSPGLNDWLFASLGARTAAVLACGGAARPPYCMKNSAFAEIALALSSVRRVWHERINSSDAAPNRSHGVMWLHWKGRRDPPQARVHRADARHGQVRQRLFSKLLRQAQGQAPARNRSRTGNGHRSGRVARSYVSSLHSMWLDLRALWRRSWTWSS